MSSSRGERDIVGTIIADRYRITSRIGGGGMGQVFKAEHIRMKRQCAIKVLRANLAGDPEATQRFQREAENASQLSHPNVAQIYDFGEHEGLVYLAMEFIPGDSLSALLQQQGALHPDIAADIIAQSAAALEAAHARQVLHRDVKPDNIMLARNPDGTYLVKLVDFGIARAMSSNEQRVTRTGLVIGTPEFMSPEQIAGEELDARSDMYALALVAFQALTGKDAFPAAASKQNLILRLTSRPRTLAQVREDMPWPQSLQTVFDRALSPDPDERFESIGIFAEELSSAISSMTPSETTALYRKALDQRVVSVASRTPHGDLASISNPSAVPATTVPMRPSGASFTAPGGPQGFHGQHATPQGTFTTSAPFNAPIPPSANDVVPVLRRRPRIFPWVFAFAVAGWAWVVATGRTPQARALFDSAVEKVTGLISSAPSLPSAPSAVEPAPTAAVDAPASRERDERRSGAQPEPAPVLPASDSADSDADSAVSSDSTFSAGIAPPDSAPPRDD